MNPCWLIYLSMVFDGSSYLNGAAPTPAVRDDDRFVIDASPLGRDIDTTAPEFLRLARSRGLARLVLMAAGAPVPLRPGRAQLQVGEFVLVAPEQQLAWHLGPTWVRDQRGETSRRPSFEAVALPRGDRLSRRQHRLGCVPCSSRSSTILMSRTSCASAWRSLTVPTSTMPRSGSARGASTTPVSGSTGQRCTSQRGSCQVWEVSMTVSPWTAPSW